MCVPCTQKLLLQHFIAIARAQAHLIHTCMVSHSRSLSRPLGLSASIPLCLYPSLPLSAFLCLVFTWIGSNLCVCLVSNHFHCDDDSDGDDGCGENTYGRV